MTNCSSEFVYKDARLPQSFSYLCEGSMPTGAICGLVRTGINSGKLAVDFGIKEIVIIPHKVLHSGPFGLDPPNRKWRFPLLHFRTGARSSPCFEPRERAG